MLYKTLHIIDHSLHFKLLQFAKLIRITRYKVQQKDRAFIVTRYNTYIYYTTHLWNNLPNETILAIEEDRFIGLAKKNLSNEK